MRLICSANKTQLNFTIISFLQLKISTVSWFYYACCRSEFYFDILITVIRRNVNHKNDFFSIVYLTQFATQFLVFQDLLFQSHIFWQYSIISESVKYVRLLHIIVNYLKENIIKKLQKLYSPPRNLRVGNKLPALFLKKHLSTGDLLPTQEILIERRFCAFPSLCASLGIHGFFLKKTLLLSLTGSLDHSHQQCGIFLF